MLMAISLTGDGRSRADIARHYMQRVDFADLLPINKELRAPQSKR